MKKVFLIALTTTLFLSCKKEISTPDQEKLNVSLNQKISDSKKNPDDAFFSKGITPSNEGYVYTESNDAGTNRIIIYKKSPNGRLTFQASVASGGAGTGALFGSQGALVLNENHTWLYAVNAGSNSVSSFIVRQDGNLTLAFTVSSGGVRPVSVTTYNNYLYVVNQVSANINGYTIGANGSLTVIPSTNLPLSAPTADPGQISFHPNGSKLYITERGTDKITSFQVNGGVATNITVNASAGVTPFGFDFAQGYLVVAHAHMDLPNLGGAGSYSLSNTGVVSSVNGNVPNNQTAACWTATTDNGYYAYIANSFSDNISSYSIASDGAAQLINASAATTDRRPRDIVIIDNYLLYVLNVTDHTIGEYRRGPHGTLHTIGHVTNVPVWSAGLAAY